MATPRSTAEVLEAIRRDSATGQTVRDNLTKQSAVGRLARRIDMNSRLVGGLNIPTPTARFVTYSGVKTSDNLSVASWSFEAKPLYTIQVFDKYFNEDVEGFSAYMVSEIGNAMAVAIDNEILNNSSGAFTTGVIAAATGASNVYNTTVSGLIHDLSKTMGLVEADGYDVNGVIYARGEADAIRRALSTNLNPNVSVAGVDLLGVPAYQTWATPSASTKYVVGDWRNLVWGVYEEMGMEVFTSGSVNVGGTEVNLIETNSVAVRAEMRVGFAIRNAAAFALLK